MLTHLATGKSGVQGRRASSPLGSVVGYYRYSVVARCMRDRAPTAPDPREETLQIRAGFMERTGIEPVTGLQSAGASACQPCLALPGAVMCRWVRRLFRVSLHGPLHVFAPAPIVLGYVSPEKGVMWTAAGEGAISLAVSLSTRRTVGVCRHLKERGARPSPARPSGNSENRG